MMDKCQKIPHATAEDARAAAVQSRYHYNVTVELSAYRCTKCDFWHLSSKREEDDDE